VYSSLSMQGTSIDGLQHGTAILHKTSLFLLPALQVRGRYEMLPSSDYVSLISVVIVRRNRRRKTECAYERDVIGWLLEYESSNCAL
jgi:hypothetical protein